MGGHWAPSLGDKEGRENGVSNEPPPALIRWSQRHWAGRRQHKTSLQAQLGVREGDRGRVGGVEGVGVASIARVHTQPLTNPLCDLIQRECHRPSIKCR